jgi:uncharacterized membrane-anchored protein YjiN (DUF445 family)
LRRSLVLAEDIAEFDTSLAPVPSPARSAEPPKAGGYSKVWWVATILLISMGALFVTCQLLMGMYPQLAPVRAFAEAALVGALADWFAVTALFRHPLGVPIPHTAIIPRNKSRIGRSLGLFVQRNFLTEKALEGESLNITGAIARWLETPANRKTITNRIATLLPKIISSLEEREVKAFVDNQVEEFIRRVDFAKTGAKLFRTLTANEMHEVMLDEMVENARGFFRSNKEWFRRELRDASPWFVPDFVDKRIFNAIVDKTEDTFSKALADKNHELRRRLHGSVLIFIEKLETAEEFRVKGEKLKETLLSSEVFRGYISSLRDSFLQSIKSDAQSDTSLLVATIDRILANFVSTMKASPALQHRMDSFMRGVLRAAFGEQSSHVADLIARTIEGWDTKTLVSKLEEQVGNDLQYIRINGTIVGGLVGLLLYAVERLL